jgi:hypothetical protein
MDSEWQRAPSWDVWLEIADLASVPSTERAYCADTMNDRITNALGLWQAFGDLAPRVPALRAIAASLAQAAATMEVLSPGDLMALSSVVGVDGRDLAQRIRDHIALSRRLAAAALEIAPGGRGRPQRLQRKVTMDEAEARRERGEAVVAGTWEDMPTMGEVILRELQHVAAEHEGHFTFNRKVSAGAEEIRGTIVEAWQRLEPSFPAGIERPAAHRIEALLAEVARCRSSA